MAHFPEQKMDLKTKVEQLEQDIRFLQNELHQEKVLRNAQYRDITEALQRLEPQNPHLLFPYYGGHHG